MYLQQAGQSNFRWLSQPLKFNLQGFRDEDLICHEKVSAYD